MGNKKEKKKNRIKLSSTNVVSNEQNDKQSSKSNKVIKKDEIFIKIDEKNFWFFFFSF